ncbi:MAG: glycoside hydrolase family 16 protein [Oscillospiraceae bacterium]|nr:glycoside hydrolase family 16 protein [Oscillospiraceae bacterium]
MIGKFYAALLAFAVSVSALAGEAAKDFDRLGRAAAEKETETAVTTVTTVPTETEKPKETTTTTVPEKTKKTKETTATTVPVETKKPKETTATTVPAETEAPVTQPVRGIVRVDGETVIVDGKEYKLSFEDNFDGHTLDGSKWEKCPEWKRQDLNNYWDNDMSYLDGEGNLIIEMSYDENEEKYLSGGVRSKGKFEQAYGYFEIRCTVNTVPGYWTAFWLMGETVNNTTMGGRNGTEIDIMETPFFDKKQVQNTLNWDGYGEEHKALGQISDIDVYDGEYHTFSLLWTESEYVFFIDGEESWRTDAKEAEGTCEVPLYMKITSETGSWTRNPPLPESLPDYMKVDHVRVYAEKK